jgi:hypothetical protein
MVIGGQAVLILNYFSVMKIPKDKRDKFWAKLECKIQKTALKKDKKLRLKGYWKKFTRKEEGLKVYTVDGEWVRNNLSVIFGHGGHGYVHEFIPNDEIWISSTHFEDCGCDNLKNKNQQVSQAYFDSTTIHEILEFKKMKKGANYWKAHQIALQKEREVGLLENPFKEVN